MIKDKLYSTYLDAIRDKVAERHEIELSGTPPLSFTSKGKPLTAWSITGNTVQNGTPTPDNPVEVLGCGDYDSETGLYKIPVVAKSDGAEPITTQIYLDSPLYKIGDYADRLSKTEDVRVVKELVLTGKEDIFYGDAYTRFRVNIADFETFGVRATPFYMSHYIVVSDRRPLPDVPDNTAYSGSSSDNHCIFIKTTNYTTVADFKSYLAAQYAAGTPVKVYYVMQTPETKTVEPVEIPTLNGTTVIDVDTAVKPENMTIKYKAV